MPSVLFAVFLLPFIFDVVLSANFPFSIESCNTTDVPYSRVSDYSYSGIPTVPLCPLSSSQDNIRWTYNLSGNASALSNQPFPPDQICASTLVSTDETKFFFLSSFISSIVDGVGYLSFLVNGNPLTVRYAPKGIFLIEPSNNFISLDEGEPYGVEFIFLAYFRESETAEDPNLYKVSASGDLSLVPLSNTRVYISGFVEIDDYCHIGILGTPRPKPARVIISNPSVADSGIYSVIVNISGVNYTTNFTINVSPLTPTISPSPTTTSSSIIPSSVVSINDSSPTISTTGSTVSDTTTITVSSSPTGDTSSGVNLVIISVFVVLVVVGIAVCMLLILLSILCYLKVKRNSNRVLEEAPLTPPASFQNEDDKTGVNEASFNRSGSTSSNKQTESGSQFHDIRVSSTPSTPSTTKQQDYTAVYCGEGYSHIGEMWRERYSDQCILEVLYNDDDILKSLENPSCSEVFVHADSRDPVIVATLSRGISRNREKLKWWQFVKHDKTPSHLIEAEGFKILQVEGDPNDISTLQLAMLKTDLPTLNHTNGALYENHTPNGHTSSDLITSYPEDDNSEKKKLKEETDGRASNDGGSTREAIEVLVQEQRKTNEYLKELKDNTGIMANNTSKIAATNQDILDIQQNAHIEDPSLT